MLLASRLSKSYGDLKAVRDVSFTLQAGQIMALVGASGSGKTTLLSLLAGLIDPDRGDIYLEGKPVAGPKQVLVAGHPQIRMVHQNYRLLPNISIRENIAYALRFYERTYQETRVHDLLKLCRLETAQHHKPREASGGENQRTAIACALAEPALVLLLDEPFSHLDLPNKLIVKELLIDLVKHPLPGLPPPACLLVTHDAAEALSISDQVGLLQRGKLTQLDTPRSLYTNPQTIYAAQMTGPVNLLKGKHLPTLGLEITPNPAQTIGLRPEHVRLDPDGNLTGRVRGVYFQGAHTELDVTLSRYVSLRLYTRRTDVQTNDQVRMTIDKTQLMTLRY